jgi:hypothetical protein
VQTLQNAFQVDLQLVVVKKTSCNFLKRNNNLKS